MLNQSAIPAILQEVIRLAPLTTEGRTLTIICQSSTVTIRIFKNTYPIKNKNPML